MARRPRPGAPRTVTDVAVEPIVAQPLEMSLHASHMHERNKSSAMDSLQRYWKIGWLFAPDSPRALMSDRSAS